MKTLKISDELHKELKMYCVEHSLKLNNYIEQVLTDKVNEIKCQKKLTIDDFIKRSVGVHCDEYDYSLIEYKT